MIVCQLDDPISQRDASESPVNIWSEAPPISVQKIPTLLGISRAYFQRNMFGAATLCTLFMGISPIQNRAIALLDSHAKGLETNNAIWKTLF